MPSISARIPDDERDELEDVAELLPKDLGRRIDSHGLHMTGELRETAYRLIDEAAKE